MKKILIGLVSLVSVFCLTACGSNKEASDNKDEKTVVTFWNGFTGKDGEVLQELVDEYNKTNTKNIEVKTEIMSWDSLYQKLATALPVGEGPDIIAFNTENIGTYVESGALANIDDFYKDSELDPKTIVPALEENLKYDGAYYGVPCNIATLNMYYNKDLFEEAGIDPEQPPKDWRELSATAEKLTKNVNGEKQYGFGMATNNTIPMWPIMIWGGGGDFIKDGKSVINSKENIETMTYWSNLIKNKGIAPAVMSGADIDNLFSANKLGMYFCGPWAAEVFNEAGVNYGIAPVPTGSKEQATLGTGVSMVMTEASQNKEGVYDFFEYWNSTDAQVKWALKVGYPVTNSVAAKDERLKENPNIAKFTESSEYAHFYLQQQPNYSDIDTNVIIPSLEKILLEEDADVEKILDKAKDDMDKLMEF